MDTATSADPRTLAAFIANEYERADIKDLVNALLMYIATVTLPDGADGEAEVKREEAKRAHYTICRRALFRVWVEEPASGELIVKKISKYIGITQQTVRDDMRALVAEQKRAHRAGARPAGARSPFPYKETADGIV